METASRPVTIERLVPPVAEQDRRALARLLSDAVEAGEAVSFLSPFPPADAEAWWRRTFADASDRAVFLVAREGGEIVGTVQLHPAWAPNQPHRAEVVKLLVRREKRGAGIATRLMDAVEAAAREAGFRLLTLDARRGGAADRLYRRLGWTEVGTIPRFALDPDGVTPHDAVLFRRELA